MDKKTLLDLIEEQKNIIDRANNQLKKLYEMAEKEGISVSKDSIEFTNIQKSSVVREIERQRKEIMDKVEKIKYEAIANAKKNSENVAGMHTFGGFNVPTPNMSKDMPDFSKMMENMKDQTNTEGKDGKDK